MEDINENIKICSFDVGIKHLAYCIINKHGETFKIEKWGNIDLSDEELKCCECSKTAKYQVGGNKTMAYCGTHKNHYKPLDITNTEDDDDILIECNGVKHKCEFSSKVICTKTAKNKFESKYYCTTHLKSMKKKQEKENTLIKITNKSCMKTDLSVLCKRLYEFLDKLSEVLKVDEILIENQPTFINPTMKTMSSLLYGYFILRGIVEKVKTKSTIRTVRFISPSNKLKVSSETDDVIKSEDTKPKIYKLTKELGVTYCKLLIKDDKEMLEHLSKFTKQDDLCDAFLQGYHSLFGKNVINDPKILKEIKDKLVVAKPKTRKTTTKSKIIVQTNTV